MFNCNQLQFLKSEADLEYIEKRLKLDFINNTAETGCPAEENPAVMLENLRTIKAKHKALCSQVKEIEAAQTESMDSIRNNLGSVMQLIQHLQQTSDVEVQPLTESVKESEKLLGLDVYETTKQVSHNQLPEPPVPPAIEPSGQQKPLSEYLNSRRGVPSHPREQDPEKLELLHLRQDLSTNPERASHPFPVSSTGFGVAVHDRHFRDLASTASKLSASTMEAENMVHSDSMSPASLGIWEVLPEVGVEDLPDRGVQLGLPGCEYEELSEEMLEMVPLSIRSNIKLSDLNEFYLQLRQCLSKNNSGSLSVQKMKHLKLKVSDGKLKVLQHLSLVKLDKKGHISLVM
ncbi:hypothetical protein L3Q82_021934 [Scortum barcoo]|uniref:Uncharacterized protein n=1 Tax=Scortum barcoo TaxID=214431 RepID=A0ACB8X012_9TELE|nr:hypothetical protein L3Q82_021934 [Scortum barcoo]